MALCKHGEDGFQSVTSGGFGQNVSAVGDLQGPSQGLPETTSWGFGFLNLK